MYIKTMMVELRTSMDELKIEVAQLKASMDSVGTGRSIKTHPEAMIREKRGRK